LLLDCIRIETNFNTNIVEKVPKLFGLNTQNKKERKRQNLIEKKMATGDAPPPSPDVSN